MPRYTIGAAEVAVNPATSEQVAPPGALSPADAALQVQNDEKKQALKDAKDAAGPSLSPSTIVVGLFVVGLGVVAYREAKAKAKAKAKPSG